MTKSLLILTTPDISDDVRVALVADLNHVLSVEDGGPVSFKSADPSFIQVIGEALQWITPLKVAASVFLAQIAKRAANDIWNHKAEIVRALQNTAVKPLRIIASALARARNASPYSPKITIVLPIPDPYFGTAITFDPHDEADIAWFVANFIVKAEGIESAMRQEIAAGRAPLGRAQLELQPDGTFIVRWMDQKQMKQHKIRIK